jgi:hypothetical protein
VISVKATMALKVFGHEPSELCNGKAGKKRKCNVPVFVCVLLSDTFQKICFN